MGATASVVLCAAASVAGASTAAAAGEPDLSQPQIAAIAEAGTVYLSGTWSGFVNYPTGDGGTAFSDQVDASFSCSGFVASSDGYIVTAGHCADPAEGKTALVDQFLQNEIDNGDISEEDAQGYLALGAEANWPVEGTQAGSPPVLAMTVYPAISITGDDAKGFDAVLVDDRPIGQGDSALFKIDTASSPFPVLVVSTEPLSTGQSVDAIGYPGNVTDLVSGNPQPTFAQGQVSGRQQTDGGPFTQIGIAMSPGMSGGPVVNGQGDVVGTVSFGPSNDTQQLNFATAPDTIASILSRNGVKNELTALDKTFRQGLDEYFAGKYHSAADHLATVVSQQPNNAIARDYQAKAVAAFPQENTTGWVLPVVLGGVGLVVVIIVVVVLIMLAGRRRRASGGGVAAGPVPAGYAPVPPAPVDSQSSAAPAPVDSHSFAAPAPVDSHSSAAPAPVEYAASVPAPVPAPVGYGVAVPAPVEYGATVSAPAPAVDPITVAPPAEPEAPPAAAAPTVSECASCRVALLPGARFCTSCGQPVGS